MAKIDTKFHELLNKIMDYGVDKTDRTGTGTKSIFHHTLEYDMSEGFPLITTKKMFTKGIITELLWFLNGSTSLRDLVEQDNNIWVGDAYKKYKTHIDNLNMSESSIGQPKFVIDKHTFIERIKTNDDFNKQWGELGPIYGKQWTDWGGRYSPNHASVNKSGTGRHFKGINQIQNAIETLKTNPDSRRIMVNAWNVAEIDEMTLPPCHWGFELYTEELTFKERCMLYNKTLGEHFENKEWEPGKDFIESRFVTSNIPKRRLSLKWHQRSVDTPLGLPFNIASYGFLLEMFAQQVNMVPHMLVGDLTNVHIYQDQLNGVKEQLNNSVGQFDAPTLKLNNSFIVDAGDNGERFFKDMFSYTLEDFEIMDYESYPTIKFPLSN
jgi:thymidylate synthase